MTVMKTSVSRTNTTNVINCVKCVKNKGDSVLLGKEVLMNHAFIYVKNI